jgi:hypothetical protein
MRLLRELIIQQPSFNHYLQQVEIIEENYESNPTLCVEACKALIEGMCKTVLINRGLEPNERAFHVLVGQTVRAVVPSDNGYENDIAQLGSKIASVAQKISEFRNLDGCISHGHDVLNQRIPETVSWLSYRISDVLCGFILRCYFLNRYESPDLRIHYEDCADFNESIDDEYPVKISNFLEISTSRALFQQDYEAYKSAYFEYIEKQKEEMEENL